MGCGVSKFDVGADEPLSFKKDEQPAFDVDRISAVPSTAVPVFGFGPILEKR